MSNSASGPPSDAAATETPVDPTSEVPSAAPDPRRRIPLWRSVVAGVCWVVILASACALLMLFMQLLALSLGQALHATVTVEEKLPIFWGFVAAAVVLVVAAIAAGVARRWVALVLALVLALGAGVLAAGLYSGVRTVIAPAEQVVPGPVHCQCLSGGDCDCPGG